VTTEVPSRPRILIADDHVLIAEACKNLLEPEFDVVGIVADGRALMQAAADLRPHVAILDIAMPQLNGLDAGEQIKKVHPLTKLIFLTMTLAADVAAEAFRRGASGYVVKHSPAEELLVAVRRVLQGESYLSPIITKITVDYLLRTGAAYRSEKQVKPGTVAFHKYRMMETLGIRTNAELIEYAIKRHMLAQ
jgi:DNA-binding NarL/FixJ family response regulator